MNVSSINIKNMKDSIKIFDEKKVRTVWDEETEEWYFSIVDVVEALTDTDRPRKYWNDLKKKLRKEGSELSENIGQLKIVAPDGKKHFTCWCGSVTNAKHIVLNGKCL